ncbi:MAG TPA: sulfotransferase domain-containing protein [Stellaceae bacterium]|jgi:hypothetical protein|nr:sulfotransferase domain-containing protein [Stellaceae bacterium]
MPPPDPSFQAAARQAVVQFVRGRRAGRSSRTIHLVSYPRSGNTLTREFLSVLQGRPQYSVYDGDVVGAEAAPLTHVLDGVDVVKSHQFTDDGDPMIYLVRDGRNATLSFLYMSFLFGGHHFSRLDEVFEAVQHLDRSEGSWTDHVARALAESERRHTLFVRYEDLFAAPQAALVRMARFVGADLASETAEECVARQKQSSRYALNPFNGYLYEPHANSIYDVLKRHRDGNYWQHIFDARSRRYFHENGGTELLMRFGYESSADWWLK